MPKGVSREQRQQRLPELLAMRRRVVQAKIPQGTHEISLGGVRRPRVGLAEAPESACQCIGHTSMLPEPLLSVGYPAEPEEQAEGRHHINLLRDVLRGDAPPQQLHDGRCHGLAMCLQQEVQDLQPVTMLLGRSGIHQLAQCLHGTQPLGTRRHSPGVREIGEGHGEPLPGGVIQLVFVSLHRAHHLQKAAQGTLGDLIAEGTALCHDEVPDDTDGVCPCPLSRRRGCTRRDEFQEHRALPNEVATDELRSNAPSARELH
mmetsp:Transcript_86480/g.280008  ORF Transcript_86480/g.280008 Transcript_86480/m.280008 type:complete len:260 (-) Transcript_86480:1665-2444(-)